MTTLAQYDRARSALAEATRIDQVLPLIDEVAHVKLYARQIQDRALLADASEFQMRAERRLGIVISAAKEAGHFREGRPKKNGSSDEPFSGATLAEAGVDKKLSSRAQKAAGIAEQAFEAMVAARRQQIAAGKAVVVDAAPIDGARSIMGSRQEPDDSLDYFPTPPWATRALVERVLPRVGVPSIESAWEPASGEGHIAEALREYCPDVYASDIHDYGYQDEVLDFLSIPSPQPGQVGGARDWIVTNPPFDEKALLFVLKAMEWARVGVAMFVRSQWAFEGIDRYERLFEPFPPTVTAPFVERVPLCKGRWDPDGSTATAYSWLVWLNTEGDGWAGPDLMCRIPPGCREALSRSGDREQFTAQPVIKSARLPAIGRDLGGGPDRGATHRINPATGEILDE